MILSVIYIILAALGLGLLIFIHELGHYFMARRVGMIVQTFSIGFGKPIYSWKVNEEHWQIGWIPFGGYVKILGMDPGDEENDHHPSGFFKKSPLDRIKVAFMGPFVNIVFAFLMFAVIWGFGGREKNFSEFTPEIGWIDTHSELYTDGVRPGDLITSYDDIPFNTAKDHLYAPLTSDGAVNVKGDHVHYLTGEQTPFNLDVRTYPHPLSVNPDVLTVGILYPANYVIYPGSGNHVYENPSVEGAPMYQSGIEPGDRIIWVDGERIFSLYQLSRVLNDDRVLLTVERGDKTFLRRAPRLAIENYKLDAMMREEIVDWQHEASLEAKKFGKLYALPYDLTPYGVVEKTLKLVDKEAEEEVFPETLFSEVEEPLQVGDKIVAVGGVTVSFAHQIFAQLQSPKVHVIVQRDPQAMALTAWLEANKEFLTDVNEKDLLALATGIGSQTAAKSLGNLHLLNPVTPVPRSSFQLSPEKQALLNAELMEEREQLEAIENPEKRAQALQLFEKRQQQLILGLPVQDRKVIYNPGPIAQFNSVFDEIWRTLTSLVSGAWSPKFLSGPIGIVQVVQESWGVSFKEVLFWLGAISLNLGVLNLLPVPVLDGGYICIFLVEMITGRPIKKKTLEKLIIPFVVLLVGLLFYVTFNDISRIFGGFFG